MRRIITLTTDFGTQDYFAGAMKGVILSINPQAQIVDITHEIPPQDLHAAAFNLLACYKDFPAGTIHVAVVDPGVGSGRNPLLIETAGHFFVGPDNGIASWICELEENWRAIRLTKKQFFRNPVSRTFHGRDIFAPVAAALSNGTGSGELGEATTEIVWLESLKPKIGDNGRIEGKVIHIDRFGNCITNLTRENFAVDDQSLMPVLTINSHELTSFREFFSETDDESAFCFFGSAGFLEVAVRNASAAKTLNVRRGQHLTLKFHRAE